MTTKCIEDIQIFGMNSLLMKYRFFGSQDEINVIFIPKV